LEKECIYTLDDVLTLGFEASCTSADGTHFVWHGTCGLRVTPGGDRTILVTDPSGLPKASWTATRWGQEEIEEAGLGA
jgi:hypothetical protein